MYSNETTLYRAIIIASIIIGSIILYFIISIIRQQKRFRRLNREKIGAEIITLENERKRVASDLHDELGPVLSAVKLTISSIETISVVDEESLNRSLAHLDDIIKKIRHIANDLMPSILSGNGLVPAIRYFIDNFVPASGLEISLIPYDMPLLSPNQHIHTYRILQEIIHNTVKHARACHLKIELYAYKNNLVILSCDDGAGFDYKNRKNNKHAGLGLHTLQTRTDILGGEIHIDSKPGHGTRYHIQFPLLNLKEPV